MENLTYIKLEQVEYLFHQSARGNHVLFEPDHIKKVFKDSQTQQWSPSTSVLTEKQLHQVKELLDTLVNQPTLNEKKQFINNLTDESRELIIRAYFNILDNTIYQNKQYVH